MGSLITTSNSENEFGISKTQTFDASVRIHTGPLGCVYDT